MYACVYLGSDLFAARMRLSRLASRRTVERIAVSSLCAFGFVLDVADAVRDVGECRRDAGPREFVRAAREDVGSW